MTPHEPALSRGRASSLHARAVSTRVARLAIALTCLAATAVGSAAADPRFVPNRRQLSEIEHVLATRYFRRIPRESLGVAARLCLEGRLDPYSTWFDPAQRAAFHHMLAGDGGDLTPGGAGAPRGEVQRSASPQRESADLAAGTATPASVSGAPAGAIVVPLPAPAGVRTGSAIDPAASTCSVRGVCLAGDDTARWLVDVPARIAYVRITRFTARTPAEMEAALAAVNRLDLRGLVLDLRGDPGGLIRSAVAVTDRFLDSGTIVTLRRRKKTIVRHADREVATRVPIAVLVDARTASAAEMMASALQDHRRAIIIGRPTYGKGAVQQVFALKRSPGFLKLTTALYRRPSGAFVEEHIAGADGAGVHPDPGFAIVPGDPRDTGADPALERALAALRPTAAAVLP